MKENEVMLGDWVQFGGTIRQIQSLEYDADGKCWFYSELDQSWCSLEQHEPIPLTPEILEKNGFERDFEDGSLIWVDERDVTEVVWGGTILTIHGENGHLELDTCMYVHELQHALRLCGIEKEIVL